MKNRKPGGALVWGVFIVGVQMFVYAGNFGASAELELLLAGAAGILILELAVFVRAHENNTLARVLAIPAGFLGAIPRYLQGALVMGDNYELADIVLFGGMFVAVLLYAAFLMLIYNRQELQKLRQARAADKARGYTFAQAEKFYDECIKSKNTGLSRDADRQRLQLLVESKPEFNLPGVNPEALFQAGRERREQAKRAEQEKKRADERTREQTREAEEKKLAEIPPRAKRAYRLDQIAKAAEERADTMFQASAAVGALSKSLQTKEKDPSISAGIASGIGGVVPAAMTASRIERENQDIRARNAAIDAPFDSTRAAAAGAWLNISKEASVWRKKAEAAKLKLTDDSLPAEGLGAKDAELSGICTATKAGERYTVKLRPGKLFLIEQ